MSDITISVNKKSMEDSTLVKNQADIDVSKRKSGFRFSEALMESADDSFDAFYYTETNVSDRLIKIYIFEEYYQETEVVNEKIIEDSGEIEIEDTNSVRYSYLILDNGPGTSVDKVFNFGKEKTTRYSDLDALNSLNGLFHYGISSHLNVGTRLYFYSRETEDNWWMNCLEGSDVSDKVFTYKEQTKPEITINEKKFNLENPEFHVSTVVFVQGVRKSEAEADNVNGLVEKLLKQFGITYMEYLENGSEIYINDIKVKPIDPFLRKDFYIESGTGSTLINTIEITLEDILKIEDAYVKKNISRKYRSFFKSEEEFLHQKIKINMYHLNTAFLIPDFKAKVAAELPDCMLPSIEDSGFYIRRNNRYIGRAAKILGVDHPSLNYLRIEIAFSPVFDDFFGIQVNKNRYDIKHSLATLILKEINSKVGTSLQSYTKNHRRKQKPKKAPVLTISLISRLQSKLNAAIEYELAIENKVAKARSLGAQISSIPAEQIIINLREEVKKIKEYLSSVSENSNLLDESRRAESLCYDTEKVLDNATLILARLKNIITTRTEQLIEPVNELQKRLLIALSEDRRVIKSIDNSIISTYNGTLLEPLNEVQTYGLLYLFQNLFPEEFDFILLDYNEAKGLDCVAKIEKYTLYDELNLKNRFENKWNSEWDVFLDNDEGAYSFVELKYKIGQEINLGHSMVLVSHLICWDFQEGGYTDFNAVDGKYTLTDDKAHLIHHDGVKKVKVVCLKKKVEEILLEDFQYDDSNSYINL